MYIYISSNLKCTTYDSKNKLNFVLYFSSGIFENIDKTSNNTCWSKSTLYYTIVNIVS